MKKTVCFILGIFLTFSMAASVSAAAPMKKFRVKELDMTISLPEEWNTVMRDVKDGDPGLLDNESAAAARKLLIDNNAYLNGLFKNPTGYVLITAAKASSSGIQNLHKADKSEQDALLKRYNNAHYEKINGALYVVSEYIAIRSSIVYYILAYHTTVDGMNINIVFGVRSAPIPASVRQTAQDSMKTVKHASVATGGTAIFVSVGGVIIGAAVAAFIRSRRKKKQNAEYAPPMYPAAEYAQQQDFVQPPVAELQPPQTPAGSVICPGCNAENDPAELFCAYCATLIKY